MEHFRKKKSLGQNFLKNKGVLREMVRAAHVTAKETIIEIGPGKGSLTEELITAGAKVVAIEKDTRLISFLEEKFAAAIAQKQLTIIEGDALEIIPKMPQLCNARYKVVANIPYYITGMLLRTFLQSDMQPQTMVLLVQREVAKRIVARDGKESILSLSIKAYGTPRYVATVQKELFSPKPKVDSAILSIENISRSFFTDISEFTYFSLIKTAFGQKRKTLGNTLKSVFTTNTETTLQKAGIAKNARPEDLTLSDWKNLCLLQ